MAHNTSKNFLREIVKPADPNIDIVAVHGLNPTNKEFHAEETWTAADTRKMWLKDFLPDRLPLARILLFGYNSNVAYETSTAGVREQAENLLNRLYLKRKDAPERPIIFICHSLGGIVVKRALVDAALNKRYQSINSATYGIAFFATPHRGGNNAKLGDIAVTIASAVIRNPKNSFMEALKHDSLFAEDLVRDFRHQLGNYYVLSFHETVPFKKIGLIVDDKSATLGLPGDRESQIAIDADHSSICKFSSADDDDYEQVSENIIDLVQRAVQSVTERERLESLRTPPSPFKPQPVPAFMVPYSNNPDFVGREEIFEKLKRCLVNDEHEASGYHARAALYGLGGVGKSQLAIKLAHWVRRNFNATSVFWIHASDVGRFQQGMKQISSICKIPGTENPNADIPVLVKAWLERPDNGRWFMIIDNADDHEIFFGPSGGVMPTQSGDDNKISAPAKLATLIPNCSHGTILVTTRFKDVAIDITRGPDNFRVPAMSVSGAVDLMKKRLGEEQSNDDDLGVLAKELECLPLALTQAAAYIQRYTLTAARYIQLLKDSNEQTVALLSKHFEDAGRDSAIPNAVAATWMITFKQIKAQYPQAADLLSLMTFFDRQEIPESLLLPENGDAIALVEDLGILKSFSLITVGKRDEIAGGKGDQAYDLHRLIQLVMQKWLRAQEEGSVKWVGMAISNLANAFPSGADYKKWRTCALYLPHSLAALRHPVKSNHDRLRRANLLESTAAYLLFQGKYNDTMWMRQECLDIRAKILGQEHRSTLLSVTLLSNAYLTIGASQEAEVLMLQTLETQKKLLGVDDSDTLFSMMALSRIYVEQGKYDKAERLLVQVSESAKRKFGPDHPNTLRTMADLALTYSKQGQLKAAEALQVQELKAWKRTLGLQNPETLGSVHNLGFIYLEQGRLDEAEELFTQALNLYMQVLGLNHPNTLRCRSILAQTRYQQGKLIEAEALYCQVLRSRKEVLGSEHPNTLSSMAWLAKRWKDQGDKERAMAMQQELVEISDRVLGPDDPKRNEIANDLKDWQSEAAQERREFDHLHAEAPKAKARLDTSSDSGRHK